MEGPVWRFSLSQTMQTCCGMLPTLKGSCQVILIAHETRCSLLWHLQSLFLCAPHLGGVSALSGDNLSRAGFPSSAGLGRPGVDQLGAEAQDDSQGVLRGPLEASPQWRKKKSICPAFDRQQRPGGQYMAAMVPQPVPPTAAEAESASLALPLIPAVPGDDHTIGRDPGITISCPRERILHA